MNDSLYGKNNFNTYIVQYMIYDIYIYIYDIRYILFIYHI